MNEVLIGVQLKQFAFLYSCSLESAGAQYLFSKIFYVSYLYFDCRQRVCIHRFKRYRICVCSSFAIYWIAISLAKLDSEQFGFYSQFNGVNYKKGKKCQRRMKKKHSATNLIQCKHWPRNLFNMTFNATQNNNIQTPFVNHNKSVVCSALFIHIFFRCRIHIHSRLYMWLRDSICRRANIMVHSAHCTHNQSGIELNVIDVIFCLGLFLLYSLLCA